MKILFTLLVAVSFFRVDTVYVGEPKYPCYGSEDKTRYDADTHVWSCSPIMDNIMIYLDREEYLKVSAPYDIPEKKEVVIKLSPFFLRQENSLLVAMMPAVAVTNRRFKLINVEEMITELRVENLESRLWPHLGLLFVGTTAYEEGWDVTLHDELVEGYVDLENFVQPGDVVGLSLVATGMERGIELARQAKLLGASYVIAGNDSAIFRANQILLASDNPIDAVFTTNSLNAVRQFLRQVGSVDLCDLEIPGVAVVPTGVNVSNEQSVLQADLSMRTQLRKKGEFDSQDVFIVPKLDLFADEYWHKVWTNYRTIFGHKHTNPSEVRNALALFAQGCTRASTTNTCSYCTIAGVADVRVPTIEHLEQTVEAYQSFGIDYVFNATDSSLEMRSVVRMLKDIGASFDEGLMIYGRAWGLAHHPEFIDEWLSLTGDRLLINVGMDSGNERMLVSGVGKANQAGSRLEENKQAVRNVASSGAHLHFSLIFGSPGETKRSCEDSLEFFEWTRSTLGEQLDQCETDIYWLNHGSPASRVFRDYRYAQELAALAGKEISQKAWETSFYQHRNTLVVPWECEEAWYHFFTSITVEEAQKCNAYVSNVMSSHEGAAPGRPDAMRTAFKPV